MDLLMTRAQTVIEGNVSAPASHLISKETRSPGLKPKVIPASVEGEVLPLPLLVPLGAPLDVAELWMYLSDPVLAKTAQPASSSSSKGK